VKISALDLSVTSTGVASHDGLTRALVYGDRKKGYDKQEFEAERLEWLVDEAVRVCEGSDLVAIESAVLRSYAVITLGGLQGAVKYALRKAGLPFMMIPPASIKKYATGKGNAVKSPMMLAAYKRLGVEDITEDEVDALWLRALALDLVGFPVVEMPALNREVIDVLLKKETIPLAIRQRILVPV
jgi:Holliday junction resolvasome RuvABC endonuclease subunit